MLILLKTLEIQSFLSKAFAKISFSSHSADSLATNSKSFKKDYYLNINEALGAADFVGVQNFLSSYNYKIPKQSFPDKLL